MWPWVTKALKTSKDKEANIKPSEAVHRAFSFNNKSWCAPVSIKGIATAALTDGTLQNFCLEIIRRPASAENRRWSTPERKCWIPSEKVWMSPLPGWAINMQGVNNRAASANRVFLLFWFEINFMVSNREAYHKGGSCHLATGFLRLLVGLFRHFEFLITEYVSTWRVGVSAEFKNVRFLAFKPWFIFTLWVVSHFLFFETII